MLRPLFLLFSLLAALALAGGCDLLDPEPFPGQIIVESFLEAELGLPPVFLSRTAPLDEVYDFSQQAVSDAAVTVTVAAEGARPAETFTYAETAPGIYQTTRRGVVEPGRRYSLLVQVPGEPDVTAQTVVPDTFRVVEAPPSVIEYESEPQPTYVVTTSDNPERQAIYVFTIRALDADPDNLTPFRAAILAETEPGGSEYRDLLSAFANNSSPLLNEENYERLADGTLKVQLPWLAVAFYGRNEIGISALDDALVDFLSSQAVQFSPTTLSPGEIPNVATNVQNGTGVFGAFARRTTLIRVQRPAF